jgi:hypothetical protein
MGAGTNIIWVDREHDLVAVLRWIDKEAVGDFLKELMLAAASTITGGTLKPADSLS